MGFNQRRSRSPVERNTTELKIYIPNSLYTALKEVAEKKQMPMTRLVNYAIDNELACGDEAFNYPVELPTTEFVDHAYTAEAGKVFRFLEKFGPRSIDQLLLARREIGVMSKDQLLYGIRELLQKANLVKEIYPNWMTFKFPKGYKAIAVKDSSDDKDQRRLERLKKEIEEIEKRKNEKENS